MKEQAILTDDERKALLQVLKTRFDKNQSRHNGMDWGQIEAKLNAAPAKLRALSDMERTGGEPDVVALDPGSGEFVFVDCSPESPKGRRSLCYDRAALDSRKEFKPENSALDMAAEMGIELLTEQQYRQLQALESFDTKTSSWVKTPEEIRKLGGAVFCDRRYNHVFLYHNGAESYYAARGFRGMLKI